MGHSSQVMLTTITSRMPRLTMPRTTYTDPEGVERTWESSERLTRPKGSDIDGVGIVALLHDPSKPDASPQIVLQKQWRPPISATVIEVPAGLIDPRESPETCAIRELKEETGYMGEVMGEGDGVSPVMFNGKFQDLARLTIVWMLLWFKRYLTGFFTVLFILSYPLEITHYHYDDRF